MPRIREYAGYGRGGDEGRESRERSVSEPETISEPEAPAADEPAEVNVSPQPAPQTDEPKAEKSIIGSIEKIVIEEKDLGQKYSDSAAAIESILQDGAFYEDFNRAEKAELFAVKEFVLTAIAQKHARFYAPGVPKTTDWLDEEYLTMQTAVFFRDIREGVKTEKTDLFAAELYVYLRKNSFSAEAYGTLESVLKRVVKVESARIESQEDFTRMQSSLARFQSAVNTAMITVKEKHAAAVSEENARLTALAGNKKQLADSVDEMRFEF